MRTIRDLPLVQKTAFDFKKCHLTCLKSIFQMSGWWTWVSRCLYSCVSSVLGLGCLILLAYISSGYRIALQVYFDQDAWFTLYWLGHHLSLLCPPSPRKVAFLSCVAMIGPHFGGSPIQVLTTDLIWNQLYQNLWKWNPDQRYLGDFSWMSRWENYNKKDRADLWLNSAA